MVILIITSHTTRHLRMTMLGVRAQSRPADLVVVSCDNDDPALADCVRGLAKELAMPVLLVSRPFTGAAHCGQVRNNAVRGVLSMQPRPPETALLVCLDQDCVPAPDFLASHERLCAIGTNEVVLGYRADLTPEQTDALAPERVRAGDIGVALTDAQRHAIARRHTRLRRQELLRRLGLGKSHKPKILGANFSVTLRAFLAVNGFDETYRGYGQEDDDFVRRLYAIGCRPAIGVRECMVYHQHHPTRAPDGWENGPNAAKFVGTPGPAQCVRGIDAPHMQSPPKFEWIRPA
jgi:hypothetical protein